MDTWSYVGTNQPTSVSDETYTDCQASPFQWHALMPFFELLSALFSEPSQLDDLELLSDCVKMLREVAATDPSTTYCGNLLHVAAGCLDIANAFIQVSQQTSYEKSSGETTSSIKASQQQRGFVHDRPNTDIAQNPPSKRMKVSYGVQQQQEETLTGRIDVSTDNYNNGGMSSLQYQTSAVTNNPGNSMDQLNFLGDDIPLGLLFHDMETDQNDEVRFFSDDALWGGDDILARLQTQY